jgi:hypothetical protein
MIGTLMAPTHHPSTIALFALLLPITQPALRN